MADFDRVVSPPDESLERRVLAPLAAADDVIDREYREASVERRAFDEFSDRLADVDTVSTPRATTARALTVDAQPGHLDRIREAFRDTVMDVPHYDDAYGESLEVHFASELSVELAAGIAADSDSTVTRSYKAAVATAVDDAIDQREVLCSVLEAERRSLDRGRGALSDLLDTLARPGRPSTPRDAVLPRLDDVARTRQETLRTRRPGVREDGHDLCGHLYAAEPWTYPLLTAVARFRETIDAAPV